MRTSSFAARHITGEGLRQVSVYRHFFRAALRRLNAADAAYEAEVRDWYENGDGRPAKWETVLDNKGYPVGQENVGGLGYAFPTCKHGTSLWVDYDNICGGCEDGSSNVELAITEGRTRYLTFVGFFDWMAATPAALPDHIRKQIAEFSATLFPKES